MREILKEHLLNIIGDKDAVSMCMQLWDVIQVWDDLTDGDPVSKEDIHAAFITSLIELPKNPFYAAFANELRPLLMSSILQWRVANEFEKGAEDNDLNKAYMLRANFYNVVHYCAYIIYGADGAENVGPSILRLYGETLSEFKEEICRIQ